MILTAASLICKALGASWSWWWLILTVLNDYSFRDHFKVQLKF